MGNCCNIEDGEGKTDIVTPTNQQHWRDNENPRINVRSGMSVVENPSAIYDFSITGNHENDLHKIILIQACVKGYLFRIRFNQNSRYLLGDRTNVSATAYPEINQTIDYRWKYDFKAKVTMVNDLSVKPRNYEKDNIRRHFPLVEVDKGRKTYEGEWKNRRRDGFGILYWKDGSIFKGFFDKDYANGLGRQYHAGGEIYFGWWVKDKATGWGMFDNTNGCHYEGEWYFDKQCGFGIESWKKGSKYTGEFKDGQKNGLGTLILEDNSVYTGQFYSNSIQGIGTFNYIDGKKYCGEWINNKMHGHGILTYAADKYYEGEFKDDMKSGFGIYANGGKIHIGNWIENKLDGEVCIVDNEKGTVKNCLFDHGTKKKYLKTDNRFHSLGETYLKR